jgi:hypothetical protein
MPERPVRHDPVDISCHGSASQSHGWRALPGKLHFSSGRPLGFLAIALSLIREAYDSSDNIFELNEIMVDFCWFVEIDFEFIRSLGSSRGLGPGIEVSSPRSGDVSVSNGHGRPTARERNDFLLVTIKACNRYAQCRGVKRNAESDSP